MLVAAVLGSQVPVLIDRYQETLTGQVAEARVHVEAIVDRARDQQVAVYELLDGAAAPAQAGAAERHTLRAQIDRAGWLDTAHIRLANADLIERPVVMLAHFDEAVAADAWDDFTPAMSKPGPSVLFAGLGAGLVLLVGLLVRLARYLGHRRRGAATG